MRRLLYALGITIFGLIATWIFLRPQEWKSDSVNTRQAVAYVLNLSNEVTRQEEGRLLWSPVHKGDKIFAGDKIKTAGLSSTTIQFSDSKSKLDIEENSIVVVSLDQNKFSLNMLEGRVFVQGNEGKDQLNLLSAGKKIDVSGNTAISVSESGESRVENFSEQGIFQDLSPSYAEKILTAKNEVPLKWNAKENKSDVSVFTGESPLLLKKINAMISGNTALAEMKPGVNYWQLATVENGKEIRSPLMKLVLDRPLPPTQIFPIHKEIVTASDKAFDFKWNKGSSGSISTIEVATDPDFRNKIVSQEVKDQTFFTPGKMLNEGEFYWRLSYQLPSGETVYSPVTSFTVHRGGGLLSPSPLFPSEKARFYLGQTNETEVKFEWKRQENVTYLLKVSGDGFEREIETQENFAKMVLSKTGNYHWEVTSKTAEGKSSILPSPRNFDVRLEGKIAWVMSQKTYQYLDNLPVVILRWQKIYPGSAVLRVGPTPDLKDAEIFNVPGKDFPFRPSQDGMFYAKVQGLDENGSTAASSELFDFEVKTAPLPPAPLTENQKKNFLASSAGDFSFNVMNLKTSWLLIAQLVDAKGGILDERRFSERTVKFNGLLPGKYLVRTNFQDEFNRKGDVSVLELEVPDRSKIPAPKLKGVKVR